MITNGANSFILEPGCFLKEDMVKDQDNKIAENKKKNIKEQPKTETFKARERNEIFANTTKIDQKYLDKNGVLTGIGTLPFKNIISKDAK